MSAFCLWKIVFDVDSVLEEPKCSSNRVIACDAVYGLM